uniref:Uncharacterized protein n=1 Tax=Entomoneis paludosa TaxID=265537 RepID=A0A7S2VCQ8_9STRA|mmetsp:Transcript_17218/g.35676  ORF Transcript_17218/g.35676 Transcript_17218/m.35676 type:complete len:153 (+) Transcript_17218:90-548(+)
MSLALNKLILRQCVVSSRAMVVNVGDGWNVRQCRLFATDSDEDGPKLTTLDGLSEALSNKVESLNKTDAKKAINGLFEVIQEGLVAKESVKLGSLGSFHVTFKKGGERLNPAKHLLKDKAAAGKLPDTITVPDKDWVQFKVSKSIRALVNGD